MIYKKKWNCKNLTGTLERWNALSIHFLLKANNQQLNFMQSETEDDINLSFSPKSTIQPLEKGIKCIKLLLF